MKHLRIPLLGLLVLAVIGATAALAVSDTYESVSVHPFTMDPDNNTCVDWPEESTKNCDPVNLVFPEVTWQQVREALQAEGWISGSGSTQWLHFNDATLVPQNGQIVLQEGFFRRYHLRLWQVPGSDPPLTLGAVHHEEGLFTHTIDMAWEDAEAFVTGQLCGAGYLCASTGPLVEQLDIQSLDPDGDPNTWRGWSNDGSATVFCGTDTDGDGLGDACDPCPADPDCDSDSWSDWVEVAFTGTDPLDDCADNLADDANPADNNNDTFFDISDIVAVAGDFGLSVTPVGTAQARHDIAPDPPNGFVDITDIVRLAALFGQSCTT